MSEKLRNQPILVKIPSSIDDGWANEFNNSYTNKSYRAKVTTEDWLEQPKDEFASAYYRVGDAFGNNGWWQTITGIIYDVSYTDTPQYSEHPVSYVIALQDAAIVTTDGNTEKLADGRLVLVRLDTIKDRAIIVE